MWTAIATIPYSGKYWWELNLAIGSQITITENKFGGSVRGRHMYIYIYMQGRLPNRQIYVDCRLVTYQVC